MNSYIIIARYVNQEIQDVEDVNHEDEISEVDNDGNANVVGDFKKDKSENLQTELE